MKAVGNRDKKTRKKVLITIELCLSLAVLAGLSTFLYINVMLGKIHYSAGKINSNNNISSGLPSSDSNESSQTENIPQSSSTPISYDKDVFNVLLIGCDARNVSESSRSDSMILLSLNKKSNKIVMTSIMRDIYLDIPGYGGNRVNAAYSYGGAGLLLETIEQNFKIKIDKYVSVNFFTFIDIIDKLGGVNISVSQSELPVLNQYIQEINLLKGLSADDGKLTHAGDNIKLTGKQAMGFSRIRYVGNDDFGRTQRQRTILTQAYDKLKGQNFIQLNSILNALLPDVTTNLTKGELFSLLLSSPAYFNYSLVQDRIPIDKSYSDAYIRGMDVLTIDAEKNISELQSEIYN